ARARTCGGTEWPASPVADHGAGRDAGAGRAPPAAAPLLLRPRRRHPLPGTYVPAGQVHLIGDLGPRSRGPWLPTLVLSVAHEQTSPVDHPKGLSPCPSPPLPPPPPPLSPTSSAPGPAPGASSSWAWSASSSASTSS